MVALSSRFALLAAFVSLASFANGPLAVDAAVIPNGRENVNVARSFGASHFQTAFRLSQAKAAKRHDTDIIEEYHYYQGCPSGDIVCLEVGKRSQHPNTWSLRKDGNHYHVSHNGKAHRSSKNVRRPGRIAGRADGKPEDGKIAIVSPDTENGKTLGYLQVEKQKDSQTGSYAVGATPTDSNDAPTKFTLLKQASTAPGNADALQPVIIQASNPDGSGMGCMAYNAAQSSDLSLAPCDPSGKNGMSQLFGYDQKTHNISPLSDAPKGSSGDNTNAQPQPSGNNDVVLNFVSSSAQSAAIEDVSGPLNDASPTVTKTVTVTGTPTASPVNANVNAVPTANATGGPNSSASASDGSTFATSATAGASGSTLTTTSAGSSPTGAPDVVNVKVVQPPVSVSGAPAAPAAPSATPVSGGAPIPGAPIKPSVPGGAPNVPGGAAAANPSSAAPTTSMNAQDVASSIANPSATPSPAVNPSSSPASASPSSTASSTSAGSSTPSARAIMEPYQLMLRRK